MTHAALSRRAWLTGLSAAALSRVTPAKAWSFCSDATGTNAPPGALGTPLGDISSHVSWGVGMGAPALDDAALTQALGVEKPRVLSIANAIKFVDTAPGTTPPAAWQECDKILSLAGQFGAKVRGDALIWNDWLPDWVVALARDQPSGWRDTLTSAFDSHIQAVFTHFAAQPMRWCGVVNEPFNPWVVNGGVAGWRAGPWLDTFGMAADGVPAYIHRAFDQAQRYAPSGTTLFINEAWCEGDHFGSLVRPPLLNLIDSLQTAGHNIGAVGLECHLMPQWMNNTQNPDWTGFVAFLRQIAKRGVSIYLTELDVMDCAGTTVRSRDTLVANYMRTFITAALQVPAVTMVTNWDFSDKYSWLRSNASSTDVYPSLSKWADCGPRPPCPRPDVYDQSLYPKSARSGLAQALRTRA